MNLATLALALVMGTIMTVLFIVWLRPPLAGGAAIGMACCMLAISTYARDGD